MEIKGIDISRWQGNINFDLLKKTEVKFVMIKAGGSDQGFYTDSKFLHNYSECKRVGLPVGAYYFVGRNCKTYADGHADAERFYNIIKGLQFEYPVVIDYEAPNALQIDKNTDAVIAFCEFMESKGYYVSIYGSDISGFKNRLEVGRLTMYDKWVAKYSSKKPTYVVSYGMWQYSSTGYVHGIDGYVDLNISYKDYSSIIKKNKLNGF